MTVLFAYDGSEGAKAAIAMTATLLGRPDVDAVVLSVWEPLTVDVALGAQFGGELAIPPDAALLDERSEQHARSLADHGARVARDVGFEARPLLVVANERGVAETIVASADELAVDLIVVGARGLTGVRAFTGSVSNHVMQHAQQPVLVVPIAAAPQQTRTRTRVSPGRASRARRESCGPTASQSTGGSV
jgi:nucleotide-binding universal stress UspA family protein